jgi:hypothetical protein
MRRKEHKYCDKLNLSLKLVCSLIKQIGFSKAIFESTLHLFRLRKALSERIYMLSEDKYAPIADERP